MEYLLKAFWALALICLPPSVVLAFFVKPMASITFIPVYAGQEVHSIADIIVLVLSTDTVKRVYPLILIFASLLFSACFALSVIEKHFRLGRLMLKKPFSEINETFWPVLKILIVLTFLMVLYSVLLIAIMSLVHFTVAGAGLPNISAVITSTVVAILFFALFTSLTGSVVFMIPMMIIYGYSFTDSLTEAFSLVGKRPVEIILGGLFPFGIVMLIEYVLSFFSIPIAVNIIISMLLYEFLIMYILAFIMVVMFDVSGLPRRDKVKWGTIT